MNPASLRFTIRWSIGVLLLFMALGVRAQFQISTGANTIDFEGYAGSGFTSIPAAGQLDSDQWAVDDDDDQTYDLNFGGTQTTGALARGGPHADPGTPSAGLFSADLGGSDEGFGIKPDNGFFRSGNGGAILLKVQNKTGGVITDFTVTFSTLYYHINKDVTVTFSHSSSQNSGYSGTGYSVTSAGTSAWTALTAGNEGINNISVEEDGFYYFKWFINPTQTGTADAIALNDIVITPTVLIPSTTSTVAVGATSEPASFSSLTTAISGAVPPQQDAIVNFDFLYRDDNGSGGDALNTRINTIRIQQGTGNDLSDWGEVIEDAELNDGAGPTFSATSITGSTIVFSGMPNSVSGDMGFVADNGSKTYQLKIALKNPTENSVPNTLDGSNLVFLVNNSSFTLETLSSRLASSQSVNSGSGNNEVTVVATELQFSNVPTSVGTGLDFSLTVSATDANGNVDLDNSASVTLSEDDPGLLASASGLNQTLSSGSFTWTDLTYSIDGTFQISADDGGSLTDAITGDIVASQAFRSANATGTWSTASDWEIFIGGWITSVVSPSSTSGLITVRNGHVMTITGAVTIDQVTVESGGTVRHTGGTLTINDHSGENDLIISGTLDLENGSPTMSGSSTIHVQSMGVIEVSANSGTTDVNLAGTASSGRVIYENASVFHWNVTTTPATSNYFPDVSASVIPVFRVSQTVTGFGTNNTDMTINGRTEVNGSLAFDGNGSSDYTFRNGISGSGTFILDSNNGSNNITGSNAQLGISTLTLSGNTLTISSSANVSQTSNITANNGTILVSSGATYDFQNFVLSGTANFTATGSNLETDNTNGLTSSLTTSGTQTFGTTTNFTFNGSGVQNTNFPTSVTQLNNLTLNNSGGATLDQAITIDGTLTLTNGILTTSLTNLPTLSSTGTTSGGSAVAFIDGPLAKNNFSVNTTFPVGDGTAYRPVVLNPDNESDMTVEHITGTPPAGNLGAGLLSISPHRYWTISRNNGSGPVSVTLTFDPNEESIADLNNLRIARLDLVPDPDEWQDEGQTANSSNTVTGSVSTFSDFTLGSSDSSLPVEFLSFSGMVEESTGHVILDWSTATEINNEFFEIQRSRNGMEFEVIGAVDGAGNSNVILDYTFSDFKPYFSLSYYRIRQVDFDGKFDYSKLILINNTFLREDISVTVFPNPAEANNINLRVVSGDENSIINIRILDISGSIYYEGRFEAGTLDQSIQLRSTQNLSSGLYLLIVEQGFNVSKQRLLIK